MYSAFIIVSTLFLTTPSYSQTSTDKQIQELKKQILNLEKKIDSFEENNTICLNQKTKLESDLKLKNEEIKSCPAYVKFKGSSYDKTLDYNVYDVLKGGCVGMIEFKTQTFYPNKEKEESELSLPVLMRYDASVHTLIAENRKKEIFPDVSSSSKMIMDFRFEGMEWSKFPLLKLGRIYEINNVRTMNPASKSKITYKYNVVKNKTDQLEVLFESYSDQFYENRQIGREIKNMKIDCTGKTLQELDAIATSSTEEKKK